MGLGKDQKITGRAGYKKDRAKSLLGEARRAGALQLSVGDDAVSWTDVDWQQLRLLIECATMADMMVTFALGFEQRWYSLTLWDHGDKEKITADNARRFDERVALLIEGMGWLGTP